MRALGRILDIGSAFSPVDFNTSDAATGHRVDMRNASAIMLVLFKGAGTAGADPVVTVQEHTASTSGTSRTLAAVTEFYKKEETTLDGDEVWVATTQSISGTVPMGDTSAEQEGIYVIEVDATALSSDCRWISFNIAATVANAQLVSGFYILHGLRRQALPTRRPNLLNGYGA